MPLCFLLKNGVALVDAFSESFGYDALVDTRKNFGCFHNAHWHFGIKSFHTLSWYFQTFPKSIAKASSRENTESSRISWGYL